MDRAYHYSDFQERDEVAPCWDWKEVVMERTEGDGAREVVEVWMECLPQVLQYIEYQYYKLA